MNRRIITIAGLFFATGLHAQLLTEDAKGKSTIVTKPSNLGFDIGATSITGNINNLNKQKFGWDNRFFWGVEAKAAINEGIANIIQGGYSTSGSNLSGFIAYQKDITASKGGIPGLRKKLDDLGKESPKEGRTQTDIDNDKASTLQAIIDVRKTKRYQSYLVYLSPSFNGNTFRRYDSTITGNLRNRYPKEKFRGMGIDFGVNYTVAPRFTFGVTIGVEKVNTIDSLEDRESVVRTTTVVANQTIIDDKKFTVKDGTYAKYTRLNIRTDALYYGEIKDSKYRFVWNMLYTRWFNALNNKDIVKNVVNLGTSISFYKENGNLAGGLYLQLSDAGNNVSDEPDVLRRFDLGFVFKVAFASIFRQSQR
jgi:hypothetical protein